MKHFGFCTANATNARMYECTKGTRYVESHHENHERHERHSLCGKSPCLTKVTQAGTKGWDLQIFFMQQSHYELPVRHSRLPPFRIFVPFVVTNYESTYRLHNLPSCLRQAGYTTTQPIC